MLSDDKQRIIFRADSDEDQIVRDNFETIVDLLEHISEYQIEEPFQIHLWTIDEGTTRDITEDVATAWIENREFFDSVIEERDCPQFVVASSAWHYYRSEIGS